MHESSPYSDPETGTVTKGSLLHKIWTEPQATLRYILVKCLDEHVALLCMLGGIARAVGRAISQYPSHNHNADAATSLLLAILVGSISGMIAYTAYAWSMSLTGGWLGGKASSDQFKTVLGWALVPTATSLLVLVPMLAVVGGEVPAQQLPLALNSLLIGCGLVEIGLGSWSTIILLKGAALIQGFSIGKALANVLRPGALLLGVILLISAFW